MTSGSDFGETDGRRGHMRQQMAALGHAEGTDRAGRLWLRDLWLACTAGAVRIREAPGENTSAGERRGRGSRSYLVSDEIICPGGKWCATVCSRPALTVSASHSCEREVG